MVERICSALKYAHEEGILHRDIKPENILIDSKGRVKIADFGIAKLVDENGHQDYTLTTRGAILGSLHYMAPEQFESPGDMDQRADIYSLGDIDEFAAWDRAMTEIEIAQQYRSAKDGRVSVPQSGN